ncbi:MAG: crossover junction endodeoxyribonuclease RuvC [Candidatus Brocadiaceae bacterium]
MRILGIDPGTRLCGYGVIESDGHEARCVEYGVVQSRKPSEPLRLKVIFEGLLEVIRRCGPEVVAVEGAFFGKNVRSALKIGEGRGVALLAAAQCGIEVAEYAPAEVKKSVVGSGRAHKSQVQKMVRMLLELPDEPLPEDAADALAIAICHSHRMPPG